MTTLRPAFVCHALLEALEASEGRRRRRKRNTTPDAIGMSVKRRLLARASEADPDPDVFETWLLEQCLLEEPSIGALRAMAQEIAAEWRLASVSADFRAWLTAGAPSQDRG